MTRKKPSKKPLHNRTSPGLPSHRELQDLIGPSRVSKALHKRQQDLRRLLASRKDEFARTLGSLTSSRVFGDAVMLKRKHGSTDPYRDLRRLALVQLPDYLSELADVAAGLRDRLKALHPLALLARVAYANIVGPWGEYFEPESTGSESKVEVVGGMLLTQPAPSNPVDPPPADQVQAIFDGLDELLNLGLLITIAQGVSHPDPRSTSADIQVRSRLYALNVRGDSFSQHSRDLARSIYGPLSEWMVRNLKFDIEDVIAVGDAIMALMDEQINGLLEAGRRLIDSSPDIAADPEVPSDVRDAIASVGQRGLRQSVIVQFMDNNLTQAMTFAKDDLIARLDDVEEKRVDAALARLVGDVGSQSSVRYSSPLDANPLADTPIIHFGGRYLVPIPGMIMREFHRLLEHDLLERKGNFSRHRARILDDLAVSYIERVLPGSIAHTRLHFQEGSEPTDLPGEVDGLVIFGEVAVIVEGKASPLSRQSRRGDMQRLVQDIERAVEDAWRQGTRVRSVLLSRRDATFRDERGNPRLTVAANSVKRTYIVNPTLHSLADLAMQLPRLVQLGLFPEGEFPWSVSINDLRIISETVRNPLEFFGYLEWRARLPLGDRVTAADELDLFGSYLLREQVHERLVDGALVHLQSSTDFDAFYMGEAGDGPPTARPQMSTTPMIDALIDQLSRRRPPGWIEAGEVVLELSLPELAALDAYAPRLLADLDSLEAGLIVLQNLALVGYGTMRRWEDVYEELGDRLPVPCRVVFVSLDYSRAPRIVWAMRHGGMIK